MRGSTETGPLAAVHRFVEGLNNYDIHSAQAACAGETSIIDDFPPYQWTGPGATTSWYRDMFVFAAEYGMSDWSVMLDEPRHVIASGQLAYVSVPVTVRWLENGAAAERTGFFTAALREFAEQWRVSAFAWTWD